MKPVFILVLVFSGAVCGAQNPTAQTGTAFRWDWRNAQYLNGTETVGTSPKISTEDRKLLTDALVLQFKDYANAQEKAANTGVKMVDLNGDGTPEVICQARGVEVCSATGNCPLWVFEKTAAGYKLLLQGGAVQTFTIQPTRTNGYLDLVLGRHESATEQTLFLSEYRGGEYRLSGCYDADWRYLGKDGEYHDSKEAKIEPCHR